MKIVLFKLSPLGDTVMFLPVVQTLRRLHPDWPVTVFATPVTVPLFRDTVPPQQMIVMEADHFKRCWQRPWELFSWGMRMRRLRPDAVYLSCDQSSTARFVGAASAARVRVGGAGSTVRWQRGLSIAIDKWPAHTIAEWEWEMARAMMRALGEDWPTEIAPPTVPILPTPWGPRQRSRVLVHAGASREYQRWEPGRFAALATTLAGDCDVVWIDRPELSVTAPASAQCVAPRRIDEFSRLVAHADLFVGNHSGAFHVAAAAGVPCVILAGPSPFFCDPPWHRERHRILRAPGLACLPCDQLTVSAGVCHNATAPMACMQHWSVENVASICRDWLRVHGR